KITPVTGYGWSSVRLHGSDMFGVRDDQPGIWRLGSDQKLIVAATPALSTITNSPDRRRQWQIHGNDIIFLYATDRDHPKLRAQPFSARTPFPYRPHPPHFSSGGNRQSCAYYTRPHSSDRHRSRPTDRQSHRHTACAGI